MLYPELAATAAGGSRRRHGLAFVSSRAPPAACLAAGGLLDDELLRQIRLVGRSWALVHVSARMNVISALRPSSGGDIGIERVEFWRDVSMARLSVARSIVVQGGV